MSLSSGEKTTRATAEETTIRLVDGQELKIEDRRRSAKGKINDGRREEKNEKKKTKELALKPRRCTGARRSNAIVTLNAQRCEFPVTKKETKKFRGTRSCQRSREQLREASRLQMFSA